MARTLNDGKIGVLVQDGLVAIESWDGEELVETILMAPQSAETLADHLRLAARQADESMPKLEKG